MFEEICYCIISVSLSPGGLWDRNKAAVFPTGESNKGRVYSACVIAPPPFPVLRRALNRKEAQRVLSVKRCAITLSFTDSGFVVSHPMTVR